MARRPSSYDSFPASEPSRRPRTDRQGDADFSSRPRDVSSYSRSAYTRGSHARRESTTDSAYSRRSARDEYARTRAKKSRRKKVLIGVVSVLAALVIGGGAAALAYVGVLNGKLTGDIGDDLASVLDSSKAASESVLHPSHGRRPLSGARGKRRVWGFLPKRLHDSRARRSPGKENDAHLDRA